ncbi:ABC transporter ATP-binding protein [Acuticoccus kandeliae]|uniref:ABC transporter ATP-binding protein n=1 Tax=Acuticoccus kandeliae TaxID=2073160 RepID=UPI001FEA60A6|nr:ABC transporter ATP-binding protein [Acuticoccus kandeliae]
MSVIEANPYAPAAEGARADAPGIALAGVTKKFGRAVAVDDVTLDIAPGDFFAVVGPSGCGKSTLLRLVAGLEPLDAGRIGIAGIPVAGPGLHVAPERRSVAVVFQSYALWPHMSVAQNVAFPVESAGLPRQEARGIVADALETVALTPFADRKPAALSGGQQQRVALARCLASRASTVLMDEPLANLDPHLRHAMEAELTRVHAKTGATTLYITHDQREAMALATRIAVMQAGRFLQVDTPETVYERPLSEDVARFIGRSTIVDAVVESVAGERARVLVGEARLEAACPAGTLPGPARLVIRPHQLRFADDGPFTARVAAEIYRGGMWDVTLEAPDLPPFAAEARRPLRVGAVRFAIDGGWVLPG